MTKAHGVPRLATALRRDERGSIMAWTALGLASLLGVAALTVDMGYMYVLNNQLQTSADAAASAAARELPDQAAALAAAQDIVQQNMPSSAHGNVITASDVQFGNWDAATRTFTDGGAPVNAVRVNARRDDVNNNAARTFFASTLGFADINIGAQATAVQGDSAGPGCLISLDESSDVAMTLDSNARIDVSGCAVYVNSNDSSALSLRSNSNMTADDIYVAGNYDLNSNAWTDPSPPDTGVQAIADPLGSLPEPTVDHHNPAHAITSTPASGPAQGCDFTNRTLNANQSATFNPGIYCGGMWLNSNSSAILNPGMYVMKPSLTRAGVLHLDSNTTMTGSGVFFYFTGAGSIVDLNSNATLDISAPTDATAATYPVLEPYVGVVIFQTRDLAFAGQVHRLNSNSNKRYFGAVYLPQGDILVDSNGSISQNSACTIFIARRYHFDSNATFDGNYNLVQDCPQQLTNTFPNGSATTRLVR